jgi:hypothetical protein
LVEKKFKKRAVMLIVNRGTERDELARAIASDKLVASSLSFSMALATT